MSLLALRRGAFGKSILVAGLISLLFLNVAPLARALTQPASPIKLLHPLSPAFFEFPALKIPRVNHVSQAAPPIPQIVPGLRGSRQAGRTATRSAAPVTVPVVTNSYTTRAVPSRPKPQPQLPTYEDSVGAPPPAMPTVAQAQAVTPPSAPAPDTATPSTSEQATAADNADGWAPAYSEQAPQQTAQQSPARRWLSSTSQPISESASASQPAEPALQPDATLVTTTTATPTVADPPAPSSTDATNASVVVSGTVTGNAPDVSNAAGGSQDGSALTQQAPDQAIASVSQTTVASGGAPAGTPGDGSALPAVDSSTSAAGGSSVADPSGAHVTNDARGPPGELVVDATDDAPHVITLGVDGLNLNVTINGVTQTTAIASITAVTITGAPDQNDTLTVDLSGGPISAPISYDGGARGYDTLVISGGNADLVSSPKDHSSGTISVGVTTVTYTNLEPVSNTGTPAAAVFSAAAGSSDHWSLDFDGSTFTISGDTIETTTIAAPTTSLTINLGDADDSMTILSGVTGYSHSLVINGDAGSDTLIASRDANMTLTGTNLTVGGQSITVGGFETANLTASGSTGRTLDASAFGGTTSLTGGS